jgi:Rrf2 family iron-sulfur cluster assembly transcriptional regulator
MISISTKHVIRALTHLAKLDQSAYVGVEELAEAAEVPQPYLAKLLKQLAKRGILDSKRGLNGGIRFADDVRSISFYQICEALEDPVIRETCLLSKKTCGGKEPCAMHNAFAKARKEFFRFLAKQKIERTSRFSAKRR